MINANLLATNGYAQLKPYDTWYFDYETDQPAILTADTVEIGTRGILFDTRAGETVPTTWPEMPYKESSLNSGLQTFISEESVTSFLTSYLEVDDISGWLNYTEIPAGSTLNMTTGWFNLAFPGIEKYYGKGLPINMEFNILKLYDYTVI